MPRKKPVKLPFEKGMPPADLLRAAVKVATGEAAGVRPRTEVGEIIGRQLNKPGRPDAAALAARDTAPAPRPGPAIIGPQNESEAAPRRRYFRGVTAVCEDGVTRNLSECWQILLEANEEAAPDEKMTDPEISSRMGRLFPGRKLAKVSRIRMTYNLGRMPGQKAVKVRSQRYVKQDGRTFLATPKGRKLKLLADEDII